MCGALTATAYALLAGLGISTLRALLMSLAGFFVVFSSRTMHPFGAFVLALATVMLMNPLASLGSGFWFSFLAVLGLVAVFSPRCGLRAWWKIALTAQGAVFVVLAAANATWLGGLSLTAFPANLLAIPWVSITVVPAVLAGVFVVAVSETLAGLAWSAAAFSMGLLNQALGWLEILQPSLWLVRAPSPWVAAGATGGALALLLPRGLPGRWLGLFLLIPMLLPAKNGVEPGGMQIDALDAGQGSAILVATRVHAMLYDTGAGDGAGRDSVASVIVPALTGLGRAAPDRVIISHGDLDHSGGLYSMRSHFPGVPVLGSLREPQAGVRNCRQGQHWSADGFDYRVLHPSAGLPYLRNDSSCVISVEGANVSVLLPGDVDQGVERRLLLDTLEPHDVLFAPHHGSASSSGWGFLRRVSPSFAIATAGLGNRFGFPRDDVRARYAALGLDLWATGECGGIRLTFAADGRVNTTSARKQSRRIWRWPAAPNCP